MYLYVCVYIHIYIYIYIYINNIISPRAPQAEGPDRQGDEAQHAEPIVVVCTLLPLLLLLLLLLIIIITSIIIIISSTSSRSTQRSARRAMDEMHVFQKKVFSTRPEASFQVYFNAKTIFQS